MLFYNMKNAIVVLTKGYKKLKFYHKLITRNISIYNHIFIQHKINFNEYDIIIFHEGNITNEQQIYIQSFTPHMKLIFKDIKKTKPYTAFDNSKNKINNELCPPSKLSNKFPLGYKHMCHFWSIDYLNYLKSYKYIIRIDEDCYLLQFNHKILKKMNENNINFYSCSWSKNWKRSDTKEVVIGLQKTIQEFIKQNNLETKIDFLDIKCPYTNFMIIDIEYFRNNKLYNKYLEHIDNTSGIYSNRWGDLPIWGIFLSLFLKKNKYYNILFLKGIKYIHSSHGNSII